MCPLAVVKLVLWVADVATAEKEMKEGEGEEGSGREVQHRCDVVDHTPGERGKLDFKISTLSLQHHYTTDILNKILQYIYEFSDDKFCLISLNSWLVVIKLCYL